MNNYSQQEILEEKLLQNIKDQPFPLQRAIASSFEGKDLPLEHRWVPRHLTDKLRVNHFWIMRRYRHHNRKTGTGSRFKKTEIIGRTKGGLQKNAAYYQIQPNQQSGDAHIEGQRHVQTSISSEPASQIGHSISSGYGTHFPVLRKRLQKEIFISLAHCSPELFFFFSLPIV